MRCPYCGGPNPETARYCIRCGRNFAPQPTQQNSPHHAGYRPTPPIQRLDTQPQPVPVAPPSQPPQPAQTEPGTSQKNSRRRRKGNAPPVETLQQEPRDIPQGPEPPGPFPPKSTSQLRQLLQGALDFTVTDETTTYGKKKIIFIAYPPCTPWQQVATLLAAFNKYNDPRYNTIVIQGLRPNQSDALSHTNGELIFDRNTRLGSETLDRFQIETGNGYSGDVVRFVLSE